MADIRSGSFYLVVRPGKWSSELKARLSNITPRLDSGEVAIKLSVAVPNAIFKQPQAKVVIPESSVTPPVLDATVLDNVREVIEQKTGFNVSVSVVDRDA